MPTRFFINQCQIITFLILKYDIIENSRTELRGIVLPVQVGGLLGGGGGGGGAEGMLAPPPLSNYWGGGAWHPLTPPPPLPTSVESVTQKPFKILSQHLAQSTVAVSTFFMESYPFVNFSACPLNTSETLQDTFLKLDTNIKRHQTICRKKGYIPLLIVFT